MENIDYIRKSQLISISSLSLEELEQLLKPLPRFRAKQVYEWITKGAASFDEMTNIPRSVQIDLTERFCLNSGSVISNSFDTGAKKILLSFKDGVNIESVLLSDGKNRFTACLSTQAGCPLGCVFCKTGSLGFKRNLDSNEIIEQFFQLKKLLEKQNKDFNLQKKTESAHTIKNIVIMGMGEPLLNLVNLKKAITRFTDPAGLNFSKRRITVSTCGIYESLLDIAKNGPFIRLALSLTTADEPLRQKLMPGTKTHPLIKIKDALLLYQQNGAGRITLEVPLLSGINTRNKDALSIAEFAKDIKTVVNIIPWNPVLGLEFNGKPLSEPDKEEIRKFIDMLENLGLKVTMRLHKGRSVMGACGQLGACQT